MAYLYNGQPVNIRVEFFRTDGVRYNNLLDAAVRAKVGIVQTDDPDPFEPAAPEYDQRFYWGLDNPKQLEDITVTPEEDEPYTQKGLKSQWIAQVKDTAGKMLAATDWMVIRKAERGVDIPADVVAKRAAIVTECDRLETAITGCADVPALIAVVMNQNWPKENN
jgi:hypothetical protein